MKELALRLQKIKAQFDDFPKWADAALGNTAYAFIRKRVQGTGIAADGTSFSGYSTKDMLVGASSFRTKAQATKYFGDRGEAGKAKRSKLKWVSLYSTKLSYDQFAGDFNQYKRLAVLPGGYKGLRRLVGAETSYKNFTWSGEMWGSTRALTDKPINADAKIKTLGTVKVGEGKWVTTVGSMNKLTIKKLEGHYKREGKEILMLSKKEEEDLTLVLDKYITNILNRAING